MREGPMRIEEPAEELPEGSGAEAEPAEPGRPPRHLVWSTDRLDLRDPFQRKWYIRQVLLHGREEDLRTLDLKEVAEILDELNLPSPLHRLWEMFLERKGLVIDLRFFKVTITTPSRYIGSRKATRQSPLPFVPAKR
jgi:hypothetical protein